jgi:hypothetical protein
MKRTASQISRTSSSDNASQLPKALNLRRASTDSSLREDNDDVRFNKIYIIYLKYLKI